MTWEVFQDLASRAAIHRHLKKLSDLGLIEAVDRISVRGQGKAAIVWALPGYRARRNQMDHDVKESLAILALGRKARRGKDVNPKLDPDWEWVLPNAMIVRGELDTGAMSYRELVEDRYSKYEGTADAVIWISCGLWGTRDQTRLDGMKERAGKIKELAWFVTLGDILEEKENAKLVNHDGEEITFAELFESVANPETNPA